MTTKDSLNWAQKMAVAAVREKLEPEMRDPRSPFPQDEVDPILDETQRMVTASLDGFGGNINDVEEYQVHALTMASGLLVTFAEGLADRHARRLLTPEKN